MGAFYIATVIIFARRLGPGTLQALFVTALLLTAVTLDSTGWLNFKKRPLHWGRILGICLMLIGVALVTYFDGIRNAKDEPLPFIAAEAGTTAPIAASSPSKSSNSVPADKTN